MNLPVILFRHEQCRQYIGVTFLWFIVYTCLTADPTESLVNPLSSFVPASSPELAMLASASERKVCQCSRMSPTFLASFALSFSGVAMKNTSAGRRRGEQGHGGW